MKTITFGKLKISFSISLIIFFVLYSFFVINDLSTSAQTANRGADRSMAHLSLLILETYLFIYVVYNIKKIIINFKLVIYPLVFLSMWILLLNIFYRNFSWIFLIEFNMSVLWVLSYIFFLLQTKENPSKIYKLVWFIFIFYIATTFFYYSYAYNVLRKIPVLNIAYCSIALLPWIATNKNKMRYLAYFLSIIPIFLSMKRGAIIALPLMLSVEIIFKGFIDKKIIKKFIMLGLIIVGIIVVANVIDSYSEGYLSSRFTQEQIQSGSGRRYMYKVAINDIFDRNFFEFLFGLGAGSSIKLIGTIVHNEWLQFLFNYGFLGFIIYFFLFLGFFKFSIKTLHIYPECTSACYMMMSFYLVLSMISTGYNGYIGFLLFGFWGYIDGYVSNIKNIKRISLIDKNFL